MQLILFAMSFAACLALSLGMERHSRQVAGSAVSSTRRRSLRCAGGLLLAATLALALSRHSASIAITLCLGWLSMAAFLLIALYTWKPHWLAQRPLQRLLGAR